MSRGQCEECGTPLGQHGFPSLDGRRLLCARCCGIKRGREPGTTQKTVRFRRRHNRS